MKECGFLFVRVALKDMEREIGHLAGFFQVETLRANKSL